MYLSSSKPFQISLSDIIEKVRCYSACCGDKERQEYSAEDFDIIE